MDKYIGRLLDNRYEILEVIGTGGMAVVYKARCHRLNRLVAIKILKDDYLEDEEFRRRFHSESQAVAMLSHPNIVSIYDVSTSVTADYIVMELIDGITLKQYMEKKGVLNWKETLHFAIQIAKALEHAHSKGIVHRDIKPHNVMVLKNGSVKVTDFGIARMMSKGNTLTKEALGSVHYISPEQAKGGRVDNRSDIYSLGVVMYEMMSGRPPYDGESPVAVAIQHINGGAAMPSTLNPNIPGGLEQIIMRAMAHEPGERYATATQMLGDLDEFRKDPGILFDYNTPPLDEIIRINKPPLILETDQPKTTAEKTERKRTDASGTPRRNNKSSGKGKEQNRKNVAVAEERRSNAATIAIITCSVVMIVAIVIFLVVLFGDGAEVKPQLVSVPNLVGMEYKSVQSKYPDFSVKKDKEVYDETYPAGQIIDHTPAFGDQIVKNETVYVTVSLGPVPKVEKMPNVVSWELSQAERALDNLSLNLSIKVEREYHDEVPADCVIRTEPLAETELTTGQEVKLIVSMGMEMKIAAMPDVVGETAGNAQARLDSQELNLEIVQEMVYDSNVPEGDVVRTEPAAGEEVATGQMVTLYISQGPQLLEVRNVIGLSVDSAINVLKSDGFVNYKIETVEDSKQKDTVIELKLEDTVVNPGDKIDAGKTLTIVVSLGAAPDKTKVVTVEIPAGMAESEITVTDKTTGTAVQPSVLSRSENEVVMRFTGNGIQTFTVNFASETETVTMEKEVNFDE